MEGGIHTWIIIGIVGIIGLLTLATVFLTLKLQHNAARQHAWLLEHGKSGRARIVSVRDTKVRDSRDHFVLEVTAEILKPHPEAAPRTFRLAVSPLDFHRIGTGEEVSIRLHPDGSEITLDLPSSA